MNDCLYLFVLKCLGNWEKIDTIYTNFYGDYDIEFTQNLEERLQTGL
jgi:hypothetical protein